MWSDIGANNNSGGEGKTNYTKIEGVVKGRILDDEPVTQWTHWIPSMNGGKGGSVDCIGRDCPVCAIMKADKAAGRPKKYNSSKRHKINFYNKGTKQVEILNSGETVFEAMKNIMIQMGDLKNIDITISKTGTGKNTKYSVLPSIEMGVSPGALTDAEKALPKYDIASLSKPLTAEQIVRCIEGASLKEIFAAQETAGESNEVDFTAE